MYEFDYVRPTSVQSAVQATGDGRQGTFLAGGMTLLPALKLRLARPDRLVDLAALAELAGVRVERDHVAIGAMTRHADVAGSADLRRVLPALAELAGDIGDPLVRNRGTLGGSIANNDPAADYPAAVLGLGATIVTNRREIPADSFFTGMFATALAPGELIVRVKFPLPRRAAYVKYPNPASRYAMVGAFVAETAGGVRVAVTGAAGCVFRVAAFEAALAKKFAPEALDGLAVSPDGMNQDLHGTAEYRAHLVNVIARRAVAAALAG
jgi:carbon-monoxide dehydrogenase medium subunit